MSSVRPGQAEKQGVISRIRPTVASGGGSELAPAARVNTPHSRHNWILDGLRRDQAHVLTWLEPFLDEPSPWFSDMLYRLQTLRRRGRRSTFVATRPPSADRIERQRDYDVPPHRGAICSVSAIKKRGLGSSALTRIASLRNGSFLDSTRRTKSPAFRRGAVASVRIATTFRGGHLRRAASTTGVGWRNGSRGDNVTPPFQLDLIRPAAITTRIYAAYQ
jgi:hypothetical protein